MNPAVLLLLTVKQRAPCNNGCSSLSENEFPHIKPIIDDLPDYLTSAERARVIALILRLPRTSFTQSVMY